jgi:hypothetical protein
MIKALLLVIAPSWTWECIARSRRNIGFITFLYLAPVIALSLFAELAGHNYLVRRFLDSGAKIIPQDVALKNGAIQFGAGLLVTFLVARIIKLLSETFHNRNTFTQCFTVTAYALGPFYLFHIFTAVPVLNAWIPFVVGIFFSFSTLYYAIPHVLKPDPPHAFGLFLMSGIFLSLVCLLARMGILLILSGKIHFQ